jgi:hypothetical protein
MDAGSTKPSGRSHAASVQEHRIDGGSQSKRRKVRKGTRSCWECRRRKMKCIFGSTTDTTCISCKRRGAECVDQQFPEQISTSLDRNLQMGDRVMRLEAVIEQLLKKDSNNSDACCRSTTAQENEKSSPGNLRPATGMTVHVESQSSYKPLNVRTQHSEGVLGCLLTYSVSMMRLFNTKS